MEWLGWGLFLLVLVLFLLSMASMWLSQSKRTNLRSYIVYLLLDDDLRSTHKRNFIDWIRDAEVRNAMELSFRAGPGCGNHGQ
jgi:hypothetical protein